MFIKVVYHNTIINQGRFVFLGFLVYNVSIINRKNIRKTKIKDEIYFCSFTFITGSKEDLNKFFEKKYIKKEFIGCSKGLNALLENKEKTFDEYICVVDKYLNDHCVIYHEIILIFVITHIEKFYVL